MSHIVPHRAPELCGCLRLRLQTWAVFSNLPVAKGELKFKDGKAKAEDVKTFLAKNADAFVTANEPQVTLKKS